MAKSISQLFLAILGILLSVSTAAAHTGLGNTAGFEHGFAHPLGGVDHILAMVAVGLFAARLGGRALWLVPMSFVGMMAVGGVMGIVGVGLPLVELGIAISVVVLGAATALGINVHLVLAMAVVGFFAVFHGHAHGAEMPASSSGLTYALGFMTATASLHVFGICSGLGMGKLAQIRGTQLTQFVGAGIAIVGMGLLSGSL